MASGRSNELIFALRLVAGVLFVFICARLGRDWLRASIVLNLILVAVFGAKLVTVAGVTTNVGNIFYSCVFLATYALVERHGMKEAQRTILFSVVFMVFFALFAQLTAAYRGDPQSDAVNGAIDTLFSFSPQVLLGSVIAFVFSQRLNLYMYGRLIRGRPSGAAAPLWLRVNVSNIVSQFLDSALFFTISFYSLPGPVLMQAILVGWAFKSFVVAAATPFLYFEGHRKARSV